MSFSCAPWPDCGVARFLSLLEGPWATLIVRNLLLGPARFTELREGLEGISAHTLTRRLRTFETHGIVTRTVHAEIPPRVVYELTDLGRSLEPVLQAMDAWAVTVPLPPDPDAVAAGVEVAHAGERREVAAAGRA